MIWDNLVAWRIYDCYSLDRLLLRALLLQQYAIPFSVISICF